MRKGAALELGARSALHIGAVGACHVHSIGLAICLVLLDVELYSLAVSERAEAGGIDGRLVHENIRRAVTGGDEAEALLRVEELDSTTHFHV